MTGTAVSACEVAEILREIAELSFDTPAPEREAVMSRKRALLARIEADR